MAGTLRVSRSRGALSGVLLILLGIWGGLVPLIGPYLHFAYTPDKAWTITSGRIWLEFLPAAVAVVGGIMVVASKLRPWTMLGASLGVVSGAWFAFGSVATRLLIKSPPTSGTPVGGSVARALEQLGFFTGLGAVIICVAAIGLGRLSVISVRDSRIAEREAATRAGQDLSIPEGATDVTVPNIATPGNPAPASQRKTPMAALVRIASRDKSENRADDDSATSSRDRVSAGSPRS
jgi:hypothetical protein